MQGNQTFWCLCNLVHDAQSKVRASARSRTVASVQEWDDLAHGYNDESNSATVHVSAHALLSDYKIRHPLGDRVCSPLALAACPAIFAIVADGTGNRSSGVTGVGRGDVLGGSSVGGA